VTKSHILIIPTITVKVSPAQLCSQELPNPKGIWASDAGGAQAAGCEALCYFLHACCCCLLLRRFRNNTAEKSTRETSAGKTALEASATIHNLVCVRQSFLFYYSFFPAFSTSGIADWPSVPVSTACGQSPQSEERQQTQQTADQQ